MREGCELTCESSEGLPKDGYYLSMLLLYGDFLTANIFVCSITYMYSGCRYESSGDTSNSTDISIQLPVSQDMMTFTLSRSGW